MSEAMKPCPWCPTGGMLQISQYPEPSRFSTLSYTFVECILCRSQGPNVEIGCGPLSEYEAQAVAAWNNRHACVWVSVEEAKRTFTHPPAGEEDDYLLLLSSGATVVGYYDLNEEWRGTEAEAPIRELFPGATVDFFAAPSSLPSGTEEVDRG